MRTLFDKEPEKMFDDQGDKVLMDAELAVKFSKLYGDDRYTMYPFNMIYYACINGKYSLELKSLFPDVANKLKELGYEIEFKMEEESPWKISWKHLLEKN